MVAILIRGMFSNDAKDLSSLRSLKGFSQIRAFASLGSTNDEALAWAANGAPDLALVLADEQTAGRGRMGRKWHTPAGAALAFSLVLRPHGAERETIGLFSGLGALALVDVFKRYGVTAQIKWPNDVLVRRQKVAGILVETVWLGTEVDSVILGMGVNVTPAALPPAEMLNFPATCAEAELPQPVPRLTLLQELLEALLIRRAALTSPGFLRDWEMALAFRGEIVRVWVGSAEPMIGQVLGLEADASLRLQTAAGQIKTINFGEVHLRPEPPVAG